MAAITERLPKPQYNQASRAQSPEESRSKAKDVKPLVMHPLKQPNTPRIITHSSNSKYEPLNKNRH
jgi:hypothetical protein